MNIRLGRMSTVAWFFAGVATVAVAFVLVGVAVAALGSPPAQQPPPSVPPTFGPYTYPPGVFPEGFNPTPPPTFYPPDYWEPKTSWIPVDGPSTAGSRITISNRTGQTLQLPPNTYLNGRLEGEDACYYSPCPYGGVILGVLNGHSYITVSGNEIWDPIIASGEEGVFDWLYREMGVAKGSERHTGVPMK